jgi:hypothetical protein
MQSSEWADVNIWSGNEKKDVIGEMGEGSKR